MRKIYNLKLGVYDNGADENTKIPDERKVFIDELNKYASSDAPKNSPILRQVLDVAERGRSLGVVLFSAVLIVKNEFDKKHSLGANMYSFLSGFCAMQNR